MQQSNLNKILTDIGLSGINLSKALFFITKGQVNIANTAKQIEKAGIGSVFIVFITAMFIGLAMSTQIAKELSHKFAAEHLIGGLLAVAIVRELAPVITSIVITGRVGASIAAEIGSMKVSEQIDALKVLGINPIRYLFVPRLISASLISPLLTVQAALIAIVAGMILSKVSINLNYSIYLDSIRTFLGIRDVLIMLLKSMVFGSIIAIIATTTGMLARGGSEAVGDGVTKTIVWCIILIFAFNYIITSIFFGEIY